MRTLLSIRSLFVMVALLSLSAFASAQVGVGVVVSFAPPELPVYEQPLCPGDGYIWTPGYWAWDGDDYYWVPGTWVIAPEVGFLWTPGWWGWEGGGFIFHEGYWGPVVGFYGGINYGYGYFGHGYEGGRWDHDHFYYNRSVNNINVTEIHNVYNTTVVNNNTSVTRVSYNGGNGGINARPTSQEEAAARERHVGPTSAQTQQVRVARSNPQLKASANRGKPPIAATPKPGAFEDHATVPAREGGRYMPPPENRAAQPNNTESAHSTKSIVHPRDIPSSERPRPPASNSGNTKLDEKYQKQQDKLYKQQDQERQKLEKQQEAEHQKLEKQQANEAKKQQTEQRHQQQTQQLMQRQQQQRQQLQQREEPHSPHPASAPPARPPQPH